MTQTTDLRTNLTIDLINTKSYFYFLEKNETKQNNAYDKLKIYIAWYQWMPLFLPFVYSEILVKWSSNAHLYSCVFVKT